MRTVNTIPMLGFGTWPLKGDLCVETVTTALSVGYRHIDTADFYGNHREVGRAIRASGVRREDIFLTSKVWRDDLRREDVLRVGERSLTELQTDYLDLLLIHWPNADIPMEETFAALQTLKDSGAIRAFGVSNFTVKRLDAALQITDGIRTNQVAFHPSLQRRTLLDYCRSRGIAVTAYSPTAKGSDLELPIVQELARKYQRSPAQIVLNWLMCEDIIAIPHTTSTAHMSDNLRSCEWELAREDLERFDLANTNNWGPQPTYAEFDP